MDGAVELLKELLTIRSVNGRDDEGAVAEYLCKYFEQSGISAHIQRIDATHANVLAELEGESDDAPIFWNGHLDTVPYGDTGEWKTDPAGSGGTGRFSLWPRCQRYEEWACRDGVRAL